MGLDVANGFFGNFHINWAGYRWFMEWCRTEGLPDPFIGWVTGDNSGDECILGTESTHTRQAREWCRVLEEKHPKLAALGNKLIQQKRMTDLSEYMYGHNRGVKEWERRAIASWYAILKHGVEHGDTLAYC